MRRTAEPLDETLLFDLPLVAEPELANKPRPRSDPEMPAAAPTEAESLMEPELEPIEVEQFTLEAAVQEEEPSPNAEETEGERELGPLQRRFVAGAIDVAVITGALLLLVAGAAALGIRPALADWPGYALVGTVLSFVYATFSLLVWGKTPGMQRTGLIARALDGEAITIGQAARRWLGGVVTVALLGLPTLLALGGEGSLSDRLSGSRIEVV